MANENTMANEIDPDKSLIQNGNNDDGISDSLSEANITDDSLVQTNQSEQQSEQQPEQQPEATQTPAANELTKPELELKGKIDLSFDKLNTAHKTLGPTADYNKILEKIVKSYKKWEKTNYGTYAKKLKSGGVIEFDGYSLPKVNGQLISDYLLNPSEEMAEELKSI